MLELNQQTPVIQNSYQASKQIELAARRLCYVDQGRGSPVLLLHGIPLSLVTWRHNIAELSQRHRVLALDLPGYGLSDKDEARPGLLSHAAAVVGLLDALEVGPVSVIGSSYGCGVALQLAVDYPDRVDRLVLVNSIGLPGGRHSAERLMRMGALTGVARLILNSRYLGRRAFEKVLKDSYAMPGVCQEDLIEAYYNLFRQEGAQRAYLDTLSRLKEGEVLALARKTTQPTLIVWGAQDAVLPVKNGRKFVELMARARLEVFERCGHFPHEEDPASFNRLVLDFLGSTGAEQYPLRSPSVGLAMTGKGRAT